MVRRPWSRRESRFRAPQVAQRFNTQKITFDGQGIRLLPVALRYSWPSELDLMAGQAGLRIRERYADWDRRPFGSDSASHISVYRSEEHTSELQSRENLVCRLLLEKKKKKR